MRKYNRRSARATGRCRSKLPINRHYAARYVNDALPQDYVKYSVGGIDYVFGMKFP